MQIECRAEELTGGACLAARELDALLQLVVCRILRARNVCCLCKMTDPTLTLVCAVPLGLPCAEAVCACAVEGLEGLAALMVYVDVAQLLSNISGTATHD